MANSGFHEVIYSSDCTHIVTMNKRLEKALLLGGCCNALFALFHIFLGYALYRQYGSSPLSPLLQMFNFSGTAMIAFMAYSSLFMRTEMASTKLGCAVSILNIVIYLGRALAEILLVPRPSPLIIVLCALLGLLYVGILWMQRLQATAKA